MSALLQAYTSGRGVDMSLDMHRGAVHNNLWSNIDVGLGTRAFLSSGDSGRGAHAGGWVGGWVGGRPFAWVSGLSGRAGLQLLSLPGLFGLQQPKWPRRPGWH
jgi:hypothetical protein